MCREPRLASLLQTNGGLPSSYLGITGNTSRSNFSLSTRTRRSRSISMRLKVRAGAQGGALTPKKTLELAWTVPQEQGCTPVHYRAVSDAQNRSLTPITSGGDSAMPSMVPLMLLLGSSKLSGVPRRAVVNMRMSPIPTDFYQH
jgi:hypothetical protein